MTTGDEAVPLLKKIGGKHWLSIGSAVCTIVVIAIVFALSTLVRSTLSPGTSDLGKNASAADLEVIRLSAPQFTDPARPAVITESVLKDAGGKGHDGYLAVINNAAPTFHIEGSCSSLSRTSVIARAAGCRHAVNGGPFQSYWRGGCLGPTISHKRVLSTDWTTSYASFGLTADGEWVIGKMSNATYSKFGVVEAVTGFGWLVRDGKSVAPECLGDCDHFGASAGQLAERTAIGVNAQGELLLLQVDGCERCPFSGGPSGLTLQQLAQLLLSKGALYAINLDGGGSSTTVVNGTVQNRPDCLELGLRCERSVASVVCVA